MTNPNNVPGKSKKKKKKIETGKMEIALKDWGGTALENLEHIPVCNGLANYVVDVSQQNRLCITRKLIFKPDLDQKKDKETNLVIMQC